MDVTIRLSRRNRKCYRVRFQEGLGHDVDTYGSLDHDAVKGTRLSNSVGRIRALTPPSHFTSFSADWAASRTHCKAHCLLNTVIERAEITIQ